MIETQHAASLRTHIVPWWFSLSFRIRPIRAIRGKNALLCALCVLRGETPFDARLN